MNATPTKAKSDRVRRLTPAHRKAMRPGQLIIIRNRREEIAEDGDYMPRRPRKPKQIGFTREQMKLGNELIFRACHSIILDLERKKPLGTAPVYTGDLNPEVILPVLKCWAQMHAEQAVRGY